ncbi:MAG: PhzF family phenazine biosynthesis protein [Thermoanaerobaculia bacterium]|nr:PhzF family phenazine biosynthesis protein [Thermoanaerobaculia bacterium]
MRELWQIDAFTGEAFRGNPAAVVFLDDWPGDRWLQDVAAEMNLSETAYLVPDDDDGSWHLRWFTPTTEVDLCGHATLASAWALSESGRLRNGAARFRTRSGELKAVARGDAFELDFPSTPPEVADPLEELLESLGVEAVWFGRTRFDHFVVVEGEETVRSLVPDLRRLERSSSRGVIVTARGNSEEVDFVSRFFAPAVGVEEDPVTGSAHCALGPYWADRLSREDLAARQLSPRGGSIRVRVRGDRVGLEGDAVTVLRGELLV